MQIKHTMCANVTDVTLDPVTLFAQGKMARDMSDKDILKMELEQLQKEVKTTREPVSSSAF